MFNSFRAYLCVVLACLCMACGVRSPDPNYYVLTVPSELLAIDEAAANTLRDESDKGRINLAIGPISLPGYLDRTALVARDADTTDITIYAIHLWSEPLDTALIRLLANIINHRSKSILALPYDTPFASEVRLGLSINRFDGTPNKSCVLDAHWFLLDIQGKTLREGHFFLESKAGNSMQSMVETLSSLIVQLGTDIAHAADAYNSQP